jgi:hypothetical protein
MEALGFDTFLACGPRDKPYAHAKTRDGVRMNRL